MKYFGWYLENCNGLSPYNAYFNNWTNIIGNKQICTLAEMLKLNISNTTKKRLERCKEETIIRMSHFSRGSDLVVKCLPETDVENVNAIKATYVQLTVDIIKTKEKIAKACPELCRELADLEDRIALEKTNIKILKSKYGDL